MRLLLLLPISAITTHSTQASLVAYWNFNELSITSAATPGFSGVPTTIAASQGSGTLDLSSWQGTVDDFAGSTINRLNEDSAEESLSLIAGSANSGNGSSITLQISLVGQANPALSMATQGTATGFNAVQLSWSTDGIQFTDFGASYDPASFFTLQSFDLSSVDALDGAPDVWLRLSFDGASSPTGNNRIDNLKIHAMPEPSAAILAMLGSLLILRRKRC